MVNPQHPQLIIIAALGKNNVIGNKGSLPWHLPNDLAYFKKSTLNHTIMMGRKTYQSIGRVLPKRHHIVLSSQPIQQPGIQHAYSLSEALSYCPNNQPVFVIGGATLYHEALPLASELWLTHVDVAADGDVFFPNWDQKKWLCTSKEFHRQHEKHAYNYYFAKYKQLKNK